MTRAHRVEHCAHIVHALFQRRHLQDGIGEPGTPFVEQDEPRHPRQALEKAREGGLAPGILEVADPAHDENQVDWSVAKHLVGDVDVAASCVLHANAGGGFGRPDGLCQVGHPTDLRDEAVPPAMRGLDEPRRPCVVAERATDLTHADLQHAVCDEHAGPHGVEQLAFGHEPARPFSEVVEYRERFGRQRNRAGGGPEIASDPVQSKWLKAEVVRGGH